MGGSFRSKVVNPAGSGGGSGGIASINGNTTAAQVIAAGTGIGVASSGGTTTISATNAGTVTSVTASSPLKSTGGATPVLSGPFPMFEFNPGGTATAPGGNTYTSWALLYADLIKTQGLRYVTFNPAGGGSMTIPAGTYNLAGVTFVGDSTNTPLLNLADGCVFTAWNGATFNIVINSLSSSPIMTISTGSFLQPFFEINDNVALQCNGTAPMFQVQSDSTFVMLIKDLSEMGNGSLNQAVINIDDTSTVLFFLTAQAAMEDHTISGAAGAAAEGFLAVASANFSTMQPAMLGLTVAVPSESSGLVVYNPTSPITAMDVQTAIDTIYGGQALYQAAVPTSAGSVQWNDGIKFLDLNPAGVITTYTVLMPINPLDGQELVLSNTGSAITTLTLTPGTPTFYSGAAVTTLAANAFVRYKYEGSTSKYRRVG